MGPRPGTARRGRGDVAGDLGDLRLQRERLREEAGQGAQGRREAGLLGGVDAAAGAGGGDGERGEHDELAGEGLGGGDADLGAGEDRQREVAFARDGGGGDVDDRQDAAPCARM
jgi:hypothetical protein